MMKAIGLFWLVTVTAFADEGIVLNDASGEPYPVVCSTGTLVSCADGGSLAYNYPGTTEERHTFLKACQEALSKKSL